jgi:hypothetical protein
MIFNITLLIIFIIILLYVINNSFKNILLEKFSSSTYFERPETDILKDCVDNYGNNVKTKYKLNLLQTENFCYNSGFVTNPSLLAGICGNNKKPLYIIRKNDEIYYGCIGTTDKKIKWNLNDGTFTKFELPPYLSNNLTIKNINPSNLIMFVTADDNGYVKVNGNTYNHSPWNKFSTFVIPNVQYNTQIYCSFTNTGGPGGFCISYIWNGRLYIMSINGFTSSMNSIKTNENIGNNIINNIWNSSIPTMPTFMYNWYNLPKINIPVYFSFNSGIISNVANVMNTMTVFLAINGTGVVKLNSSTSYNYSTPNKLINFDVSNVILGDKLIIDCQGINIKKGSPLLTIAYVYKGYIFVLNNYNNNTKDIIGASNIISFECKETQITTTTEIMFAPKMTSTNTVNGYVTKASSVYQNNNGFTGPWNAFDQNVNTWWHSGVVSSNLYNANNGLYTGINQLTFTNSRGIKTTVKGEWLQLNLPDSTAFPLTRYEIQGRQGCCGNPNGRDPNTWYILGWNGTEWQQVDYQSNIAFNWKLLSFTVSNPKPYSAYIIITTVAGSNAGSGSRNCVQIATWNLYTSTKYITNSTLITNSSVVTPPIMTGWLSASLEQNNFTFSTNIGTK